MARSLDPPSTTLVTPEQKLLDVAISERHVVHGTGAYCSLLQTAQTDKPHTTQTSWQYTTSSLAMQPVAVIVEPTLESQQWFQYCLLRLWSLCETSLLGA